MKLGPYEARPWVSLLRQACESTWQWGPHHGNVAAAVIERCV